MELGKSKEDYLKAILILQKKIGNVHSVNVAEYTSVSVAVKQLRNKGYLVVDESGNLCFSQKGQKLASQVYERYDFLTKLFCQFGVPVEIARKDACLLEHDIRNESFERLKCVFA